MSDAPETIWRWAVQNCVFFIEYSDLPVISEHLNEYTRTDIAQARDLGIIEGDAVAHMLVVSLQARVAELEAELKIITDRAEMSVGYNDDFFNFGWIVKQARAALKAKP
jgi:hypothetical protein